MEALACLYLGRVEEELLAPQQPGLGALFDGPLEEAPKDLQAETLPDAGERGVVGQPLVEIVS
jgi:hypothetical protein